MKLSGKRIAVIGLGITGFYTAIFLASQNAEVIVNDIKPENELDQRYVKVIKELAIELKTGGYDEKKILNSDMIVISPGVPKEMDVLKKAKDLDIPVIGEIELAYKMIKKPIIAVTGTNGKSTVTSLIGHILESVGIKTFVGGNIGVPFISYLTDSREADIIVLEVSSYQLESIKEFSPFISVILNITEDHLDRYGSFKKYANTKLRIFRNQKKGSYIILNDDDKILANITHPYAQVLRYGIKEKAERVAYLKDEAIRICYGGKEMDISLKHINIFGIHNIINLMPAIICCLIIGVDKELIQKAINSFKGLPHRLEPVLEKNGILFIDDSKATNVDAAINAINSIKRDIILIAGGRDKGLDYKELVKAAKGKVKYAVFIGESAPALFKLFSRIIPSDLAADMYDAVKKAYSRAKTGDVILLSPACSSFDMFRDYSHRGEVFKDAVRRIFDDKKEFNTSV